MTEVGTIGHVALFISILFTVALIVVRIMGNRTVGQLSPFDFIIMVGLGDIIVTASMDKDQSIASGIEGLVALLFLQQLLSYLSLHNATLRKWVEGTPVTLIEDGKILHDNFARNYFNYDDLRQELHKLGMDMTNLPDIKLARLESCGVFSIIKKPEMDPLTKHELERFLQNLESNPLSPLGQKWAQFEKYMSEVHYLVEYLKEKDNSNQSQQNDDGT